MIKPAPLFRFKVCLLGDAGVGKTSLVNRVTAGIFNERYLTTVGLRVEAMKLQIDGHEIELGLWDLAGGMENRALVRSGYAGTAGVFVVTDPTRAHGLVAAMEYARWIQELRPNALALWVFNKSDLRHAWLPENLPDRIGTGSCLTTSAKTGEGVEEAFREMARGLVSMGLANELSNGRAGSHIG